MLRLLLLQWKYKYDGCWSCSGENSAVLEVAAAAAAVNEGWQTMGVR